MQDYLYKLKINFIEQEDGSASIQIDWDETDPDLQFWTDLGLKAKETFIINSLREALDCYVD